MSEQTLSPTLAGAKSASPSWLRWFISAVFALVFALAIWQAVFMFTQAAGGNGLSGLGVFVMLLPILFPAVAFLAVLGFARRQRVWRQALLFVLALGVTGIFWLNMVVVQLVAGSALVGS